LTGVENGLRHDDVTQWELAGSAGDPFCRTLGIILELGAQFIGRAVNFSRVMLT
jgi:hypothetical protein